MSAAIPAANALRAIESVGGTGWMAHTIAPGSTGQRWALGRRSYEPVRKDACTLIPQDGCNRSPVGDG
jgi:hypothetical protein